MTPEQLKASILQYAIQGKLVEQRSEEGTAEKLYKQIQKEKQKLIKEGKIKKEKSLDDISNDEIPFDIPDNWKWVRMADLCTIVTGKRDANFGSKKGTYLFFTCAKDPIRCNSYSFSGESILLAGNGDIGNISYYCGQFEAYQRTYVLQPFIEQSYLSYVFYHLHYNWKQYNTDKTFGTAIPYIRLGNVQKYLIALPPIEEQHRIVAKIEELLPYVDRYAEAYENLEQFNAKFPEDMKKSILQYAIQGKLVEQRPEEGISDDYLSKIVKERNIKIKKGEAKNSRTLTPITENDKLFDIPFTWKWIRLGEIASVITKGTTPRGGKISYLSKGIGFLRAENVAGLDKLDKSNLKYIDEKTHNGYLKRSIIEANDILITIAGTLGRTGIVREEDLPLNANQAVSILRLAAPDYIDIKYLVFVLNAPDIQSYLTQQKKTTAIPNLTLEIIENCVCPLPPLKEQHRIVDKIEELLPYCEQVKAHLNV